MKSILLAFALLALVLSHEQSRAEDTAPVCEGNTLTEIQEQAKALEATAQVYHGQSFQGIVEGIAQFAPGVRDYLDGVDGVVIVFVGDSPMVYVGLLKGECLTSRAFLPSELMRSVLRDAKVENDKQL